MPVNQYTKLLKRYNDTVKKYSSLKYNGKSVNSLSIDELEKIEKNFKQVPPNEDLNNEVLNVSFNDITEDLKKSIGFTYEYQKRNNQTYFDLDVNSFSNQLTDIYKSYFNNKDRYKGKMIDGSFEETLKDCLNNKKESEVPEINQAVLLIKRNSATRYKLNITNAIGRFEDNYKKQQDHLNRLEVKDPKEVKDIIKELKQAYGDRIFYQTQGMLGNEIDYRNGNIGPNQAIKDTLDMSNNPNFVKPSETARYYAHKLGNEKQVLDYTNNKMPLTMVAQTLNDLKQLSDKHFSRERPRGIAFFFRTKAASEYRQERIVMNEYVKFLKQQGVSADVLNKITDRDKSKNFVLDYSTIKREYNRCLHKITDKVEAKNKQNKEEIRNYKGSKNISVSRGIKEITIQQAYNNPIDIGGSKGEQVLRSNFNFFSEDQIKNNAIENIDNVNNGRQHQIVMEEIREERQGQVQENNIDNVNNLENQNNIDYIPEKDS